jgi:hypothetical protein
MAGARPATAWSISAPGPFGGPGTQAAQIDHRLPLHHPIPHGRGHHRDAVRSPHLAPADRPLIAGQGPFGSPGWRVKNV